MSRSQENGTLSGASCRLEILTEIEKLEFGIAASLIRLLGLLQRRQSYVHILGFQRLVAALQDSLVRRASESLPAHWRPS